MLEGRDTLFARKLMCPPCSGLKLMRSRVLGLFISGAIGQCIDERKAWFPLGVKASYFSALNSVKLTRR